MGVSYGENFLFLCLLHGITLKLRQRILRVRGLVSRANRSDPLQDCQATVEELEGSGSTVGYRQMTQRLVLNHGIVVDKELLENY